MVNDAPSCIQRQSVHKEELTKSESERQLRKKIEANAAQQQSRKSAEASPKYGASSGNKRRSASSSPAKVTACCVCVLLMIIQEFSIAHNLQLKATAQFVFISCLLLLFSLRGKLYFIYFLLFPFSLH